LLDFSFERLAPAVTAVFPARPVVLGYTKEGLALGIRPQCGFNRFCRELPSVSDSNFSREGLILLVALN
jgi:hypothetical protein